MPELDELIEKQIKDASDMLDLAGSNRDVFQAMGALVCMSERLLQIVQNQQNQIAFLNERCDTQRGRDDDQQRAIETLAMRLNAMEVQR